MDNDKQKLQILQTKLGEMYLKKAEGAYIRSRAKWIEEGERSTYYNYKIVTLIFANRLKKNLHKIISDSQSGFMKGMKGRSIHNNIRLSFRL